ncbi:MAG: arsenate reductase ArsC [Candidatus Zixiibacteriota bacterium]|nr:MAG: arsenate reductase ArsC [candidate division Zixibacteria bacterium]
MKKILFVCTGNSCRSQMAEGFARALSDGNVDVKSAGISPIGVHPAAIMTMKEAGIDISEQTSDLLTPAMIRNADYVITLCNSARDNCPVIPRGVRHFHWDITNPDRLFPSEEARRREFARVRDDLRNRIEKLFRELEQNG